MRGNDRGRGRGGGFGRGGPRFGGRGGGAPRGGGQDMRYPEREVNKRFVNTLPRKKEDELFIVDEEETDGVPMDSQNGNQPVTSDPASAPANGDAVPIAPSSSSSSEQTSNLSHLSATYNDKPASTSAPTTTPGVNQSSSQQGQRYSQPPSSRSAPPPSSSSSSNYDRKGHSDSYSSQRNGGNYNSNNNNNHGGDRRERGRDSGGRDRGNKRERSPPKRQRSRDRDDKRQSTGSRDQDNRRGDSRDYNDRGSRAVGGNDNVRKENIKIDLFRICLQDLVKKSCRLSARDCKGIHIVDERERDKYKELIKKETCINDQIGCQDRKTFCIFQHPKCDERDREAAAKKAPTASVAPSNNVASVQSGMNPQSQQANPMIMQLQQPQPMPNMPIMAQAPQIPANPNLPICHVCARQFQSLEKLQEHETKSELHRSNLMRQRRQEVLSMKTQAPVAAPSPMQMVPQPIPQMMMPNQYMGQMPPGMGMQQPHQMMMSQHFPPQNMQYPPQQYPR